MPGSFSIARKGCKSGISAKRARAAIGCYSEARGMRQRASRATGVVGFAQSQALLHGMYNQVGAVQRRISERYGRLVSILSQEQRSLLMRGMGAFAAVLVVLLVVGTFADYQIAQAIYTPDNPLVIFVSSLGLFPLAYPVCLFLGVLAQRSLASQKSRVLCIAGVVLCVALAMLFGALITRAVLSIRDGFGGVVGYEPSNSVRMGIGAVIGVALCALGFNAGKANDAKDLARRMLMVVVVLVASFLLVEVVKNLMSRPRPRLLFAGYEGIEFCPWYNYFSGAEDFMATYDIEKDAFKSFPSGHSLQAAALLAAFYGLSLVYPGLRQKLGIILAVEIVFALVIMSCRMILGAHFLSDVSMGAVVSVVAFFIIMALHKRPPQRSQLRPDEGSPQLEGSDERPAEKKEEAAVQ